MRLPRVIEREIQSIESTFNNGGGQHAGTFRLGDLRYAVERVLTHLGAKGHIAELDEKIQAEDDENLLHYVEHFVFNEHTGKVKTEA